MKQYTLCAVLSLTCSAMLYAQIPDPRMVPFIHGVASGDALSDKVIIWTRISRSDSSSFTVRWQIATDTSMTQIVNQGTATTDASVDYTVKVDVGGLQPDTWYYYQFAHDGRKSLIGRTKTLPAGNNFRIRVAVASCARYGNGDYYNAYRHIAERNDIQAVIFLGDYIYEGGGGISGRGITVIPDHELITLQDYRQRYFSYRLDPDLIRVHQQYPFYNIWDDHETANNSWYGGADAHDPASEGDWFIRKANGQQAFFEWLPIRAKASGSFSIYRSFHFGTLADFILLDTRLEGRDEQAPLLDQAAYADTGRTILGAGQRQWLLSQLSDSDARWRIIGNQVMFAPLMLGNFAFNNDQWDGYQADRNRIITHVMQNGIENVVIVTGDIHTSWANDVPQAGASYDPSTGSGSAFVEFITPSISTGTSLDNNIITVINAARHVKYVELTKSGYFILDIDTQRTQAEWYHVSTVKDAVFTVEEAAFWYVRSGERFLRQASAPAPAIPNPAPFAPLAPDNVPAGGEMLTLNAFVMRTLPCPVQDELIVQLSAPAGLSVQIRISDAIGRVVAAPVAAFSSDRMRMHLSVGGLPKGIYFLRVHSEARLSGSALFVKI